MKCAIETGSVAVIYTPRFIKIVMHSRADKREYTEAQASWRFHKLLFISSSALWTANFFPLLSGTLNRDVRKNFTDVSEENVASSFKVEESGKEKHPAWKNYRFSCHMTVNLYQTTGLHIPEICRSRRCGLKSTFLQ
jgi:hypothetical protein